MKPLRYCLLAALLAVAPTVETTAQLTLVAELRHGEGGQTAVSIGEDRVIVSSYWGTDGRGAAYIYNYDGVGEWNMSARLQAADGQVGDYFSSAVSLSGDRAIIGASEKGGAAGAAYIFEFDGESWNEVFKLAGNAGDPSENFGDHLGRSVSIHGDRAIVGSYQDDTGGLNAGAAYVLERDGAGNWTEAAKLVASDIEAGDGFGYAVAIDGDRAIVGSVWEDSAFEGAGAAYIFERNPTGVWTEAAKLTMMQGAHALGFSVSIDKDRAVVGAPYPWNTEGLAYVFQRDETGSWPMIARLFDARDGFAREFGLSVAISGNRIVVGAPGAGDDTGAVYVFEGDANGVLAETAMFTTDSPGHELGRDVSISGNRIAAGSLHRAATYIFEAVPVGIEQDDPLPNQFSLSQNYPNPFNPATTITYALPKAADVTLTVVDVLGRQIRELASGTTPAGTHVLSFDATGLPSGIYFYRLIAGDYVETKRMVVVK